MLMPKRTKFRKSQRGRNRGKAQSGNSISFGDFGLLATEHCWLTQRQIEAARRAMTRYIKRGGKVWIRVFPDKSVTKIPQETRMGNIAQEALRLASHKLPIKSKFIKKEVWD